jgi:hypothetical protein
LGKPWKNKTGHMRCWLKNFVFFALIILPRCANGQEPVEEKLLETLEESSEQSELYDLLLNLKQNPINLNTADMPELERIPVLTPSLREEIIKYRKRHSAFKSKDELLLIPGMDAELFELIAELVYVSPPALAIKTFSRFKLRSRISDQVDRPIGFKNGTYESSPQKLYNKLQYQLGERLHAGLLLEKDSGERRWDDLRLFYISSQITKNLSLLVGNYQLEVGQGLVLWGPYGFSKSADAVFPIRKTGRGYRGYTSVDENAALFGGCAKLDLADVTLTAFASRQQLDATAISEDAVSGLFDSGFHRTETEADKKDALTESVFGGRIQYARTNRWAIGGTFYFSSFDKEIANPDIARNRFDFRGRDNHVAGLDWEWRSKNLVLFGEVARSKNGGHAALAGAQFDFKRLQLALLYRNYSRDFQNFHGFGFAEVNGTTQNEKGYYTGLHYKITRSTTLNAFHDIFFHPWRTFFEPLPLEGQETLIQLEQKVGRQINFTLRFRSQDKQQIEEFRDAFAREKDEFVLNKNRQWRAQLDYHFTPQLALRSRVEYVTFALQRFNPFPDKTNEQGVLLYQEFRFKLNQRVQLSARLTFFDTDSFDSRVFQYENDLPGLATNRALFGEGSRWYILVKYQPHRFIELSAKYSETFRDDVEVIGSGADQIAGSLDRRFGLQLDAKL